MTLALMSPTEFLSVDSSAAACLRRRDSSGRAGGAELEF